MGIERVNRRLFLTGGMAAAGGLALMYLGLDNIKSSRNTVSSVAAAGIAPTTFPPKKIEQQPSATAVVKKDPVHAVSVEATPTPELGDTVESKKMILRNKYQLLLETEREKLNLFNVKKDANIVILPLDEKEDLEIDINGEAIAPAASLIKVWALLHAAFAHPWDIENVVNSEKAYRMIVESWNTQTADYICEHSQDQSKALDEINEFLWSAVGLSRKVGITNWTFPNYPELRSHVPLESAYVYDQRLVGIDNPTTLQAMVETFSMIESDKKLSQAARRAWEMGYGQNRYGSFTDYLKDVGQTIAAAKTLMSQRSEDPTAETQLMKAIAVADFPEGIESDYGKGGTLGNLIENWNRGRFVTEARVINLTGKRYVVAYSAWSFGTEDFLQDALSYMVDVTNASK